MNKPRGLIIHGILEHAARYKEFADQIPDVDWYAPDLRGHGKSDGSRGQAPEFESYITDMVEIFNKVQPDYIVAHSMGGLIATRLIQRQLVSVKKLVLSAPALGLMPPWLDTLAERLNETGLGLLGKLRLAIPWKYRAQVLTSDPVKQKEVDKDPLIAKRTSATVLAGLAQESLFARRTPWPKSYREPEKFLCIYGGKDSLVNPASIEDYFPKKCLIKYPDNLHECFNERNRKEIYERVRTFLAH